MCQKRATPASNSPKRHVQILNPSTCKCDLIWKKIPLRRNPGEDVILDRPGGWCCCKKTHTRERRPCDSGGRTAGTPPWARPHGGLERQEGPPPGAFRGRVPWPHLDLPQTYRPAGAAQRVALGHGSPRQPRPLDTEAGPRTHARQWLRDRTHFPPWPRDRVTPDRGCGTGLTPNHGHGLLRERDQTPEETARTHSPGAPEATRPQTVC